MRQLGEIICVVSGKGGVGKTTVVANLALSFAMRDKKVVCIDCDAGLNNLDLTLGLEGKTVFDLADVLEERCPVHKALVTHQEYFSLSMISAPADFAAHIDPKKLRLLCKQLAQSANFVLLDCPAGLGDGFAAATYAADRALVVSTPDITAIRDASRAAQRIVSGYKIPVHLIVNRMRSLFVKKGYFDNIDNIMDEIGLPLIGIIPEDEKIMVCCNGRRSVFSEKRACSKETFHCIARRLSGENVPLSDLWRK